MKITVISDDRPDLANPQLSVEHGLSFYINYGERNVLCDFGASDMYAHNADYLGINLSDIDFTFISHAHCDHTGGMSHFLANFSAPVHIAREVFSAEYLSSRRNVWLRDIGADSDLQTTSPDRFRYSDSSEWLAPDIAIVRTENLDFPMPYCNKYLYKQVGNDEPVLDDFLHERSLVFNTPDGLVIVNSCSHCGMLNIIASCKAFTGVERVHAYVGGLHLVDDEHAGNEVEFLKQELATSYPDLKIYTGHCTGENARNIFSDGISNVEFFHVGKVISL